MHRKPGLVVLSAVAAVAAFAAAACGRQETAAPAPKQEAAAPPARGDAKIPITTSSPEARAEFVQGRDLVEKLRVTDAIPHFQKAVALDPNFAWAELQLAQTAPTGKEFFEHVHKAVALADHASNGERLMILAAEAGSRNDAVGQKQQLEALVSAYPDDERAHFALGGFYFAQQDYAAAIEHYRKATELSPTFSTAFNILGYAHRQNRDYAAAEKAFQRYIELIPKDPNPYDSYAELLLKMGRYDDSIVQYRKALEIDPNFVNAHQGIAMALLYSGRPADAERELAELAKKARTDAERRTALFARTIVHLDGGDTARALADLDEQLSLGGRTNDVPALAGNHNLKGLVLLESGRADAAKKEFETAVALVEKSNLPADVKANAALVSHYNLSRVALAKKDVAGAKKEADVFRQGAATAKNPFSLKNAHELDGIIALAEKDYDRAIAELSQANPQNPQDLYRLCQAYGAKGDAAKAADFCHQAADFNSLPLVNYALVRTKAKAALAKKG